MLPKTTKIDTDVDNNPATPIGTFIEPAISMSKRLVIKPDGCATTLDNTSEGTKSLPFLTSFKVSYSPGLH